MSTAAAALAAIESAVRPVRAPRPERIDPERPNRPTRAPRASSRPERDGTRAVFVETDATGAFVVHMHTGRPAGRDPEAELDTRAASLLADAQKAAPGVAIKVLRGRHVMASVAATVSPAPADALTKLGKPG